MRGKTSTVTRLCHSEPEELVILRRFTRAPHSLWLIVGAMLVYSGEQTPEQAYERWLKSLGHKERRQQIRQPAPAPIAK